MRLRDSARLDHTGLLKKYGAGSIGSASHHHINEHQTGRRNDVATPVPGQDLGLRCRLGRHFPQRGLGRLGLAVLIVPGPDARAAFLRGDQPLLPITENGHANWLLCAKCRILSATNPIVLSWAALVGNTLLRQPRTKLTRMINRASYSMGKILLQKVRMWYEDLPPATALSVRTCVLFAWTMIIAASAYSLADLMPY